MATMTIRTTVAFDPATAARLERLAKRWGVSKSETLRRALETVENTQPASRTDTPEFSEMTPPQILDWLAANPPVPPGWGADFRSELREQRERDAQVDAQREQTRVHLPVRTEKVPS